MVMFDSVEHALASTGLQPKQVLTVQPQRPLHTLYSIDVSAPACSVFWLESSYVLHNLHLILSYDSYCAQVTHLNYTPLLLHRDAARPAKRRSCHHVKICCFNSAMS